MNTQLGIPSAGGRFNRVGGRGIPFYRPLTAPPPGLVDSLNPQMGETATEQTAMDLVKTVAPYVKAAMQEDSATEDVETLKAQIRNHTKIRNYFPSGSPPWVLYDNKINVLKAKLKAAKHAQKEEKEAHQSKREWAALGKTTAVVGIAVGAAIIGLLINAARAVNRPPPPRAVRRRVLKRVA